MIRSNFVFANTSNLENNMAKLSSSTDICFVSFNLREIHETVSDER